MENQNQHNNVIQQQGAEVRGQTMLPHSIAVLATGILSIQFSFAYGMGLAFGIVALILSSKSGSYLFQNPAMYSEGSIKMYRAGRTCAIIGLILSALIIIGIFGLFYFDVLNFNHYYHPKPMPPPPPLKYG